MSVNDDLGTRMKEYYEAVPKTKAKELDYIFEELIASLCENRNQVVKPVTVHANAHYAWCDDHWEKVGEIDVT